jgi:nucleotide-binding universal stress UspA family protein
MALKFQVIVVPIDFSDYSLRALPYAISLAERFEARLKVVYINEPSLQVSDVAWVGVDERSIDDDHLAQARRALERLVIDKIPNEIATDAEILTGDPVDKIVAYATDQNADLIIMATHGRGGLSHVLMGSVAEHVVRKAPCPVLTLKQPMTVTAEMGR